MGEQPPLSFMSLSRVWATLSSQSFSCHHWLGACDDSGPNQRSSQKPSFQPKLPLRVTWSLWPSPGADQHRLGGLKLQKWVLSVQEAGSGSRGVSRAVPPQSSQGEPFLVCTGFWRLQAFLALWLHHSSLCLRCSHHLSLPLQGHSLLGLGPTLSRGDGLWRLLTRRPRDLQFTFRGVSDLQRPRGPKILSGKFRRHTTHSL